MNSKPESTNEPGWKKTFFTVWTGQTFSLLGSQLVQFALIWYLTRSTGSATVLAFFLPAIMHIEDIKAGDL